MQPILKILRGRWFPCFLVYPTLLPPSPLEPVVLNKLWKTWGLHYYQYSTLLLFPSDIPNTVECFASTSCTDVDSSIEWISPGLRVTPRALSHSAPKIPIASEENALTLLPCPHYHCSSSNAESQHWISLYLHDCHTQTCHSHSLTAAHSTCSSIFSYFQKITKWHMKA